MIMTAISPTFQSHEPRLIDLLEQVHNGDIQLPDFQRNWVWDDEDIRSLLASVSLAYPIGALMLLDAQGAQVQFQPREVSGAEKHPRVTPKLLILDGQQRITSLYGAL